MQERTKDRIESGGAWLLESVASAVPVFGTPIALAISKTIASADAEKVQKQIAELQEMLSVAIENKHFGLEALSTDEFIANLHFVLRQLQETTEASKRARLKNALVAGAERRWRSKAESFTRIIARIEEPHVEVLSALYEITDGTHRGVRDGTIVVQEKRSSVGIQRSESYYRVLFEQLSAENLVVVTDSPRFRRSRPINESSEQDKKRSGSSLKLTNTGISFITFLSWSTDEDENFSPHSNPNHLN